VLRCLHSTRSERPLQQKRNHSHGSEMDTSRISRRRSAQAASRPSRGPRTRRALSSCNRSTCSTACILYSQGGGRRGRRSSRSSWRCGAPRTSRTRCDRGVPLRHRRDSCPSHDAVDGSDRVAVSRRWRAGEIYITATPSTRSARETRHLRAESRHRDAPHRCAWRRSGGVACRS
jgi:hypothetical protein